MAKIYSEAILLSYVLTLLIMWKTVYHCLVLTQSRQSFENPRDFTSFIFHFILILFWKTFLKQRENMHTHTHANMMAAGDSNQLQTELYVLPVPKTKGKSVTQYADSQQGSPAAGNLVTKIYLQC